MIYTGRDNAPFHELKHIIAVDIRSSNQVGFRIRSGGNDRLKRKKKRKEKLKDKYDLARDLVQFKAVR